MEIQTIEKKVLVLENGETTKLKKLIGYAHNKNIGHHIENGMQEFINYLQENLKNL